VTVSRRSALLAEMGLGPVWRLRANLPHDVADETVETPGALETAATAEAAATAAAAGTARTATSVAPAVFVAEPTAGAARPPSRATMPARTPPTRMPAAAPTTRAETPSTRMPARAAVDAPGAVPAAPRAPVSPLPPLDPARAQEIGRMAWDELRDSVAGCTACGLCRTRTNTVFGVGAERPRWMIVGEAPGAEEDERGEPFVGQAGRLLDNMLAAIGRSRAADVYIANVLKCRPPGNRNPEPGEVERCSPFLLRQIDLAQPQVLIAMGRFAAQTLLGTDASIASLRGRVHRYHGVPCVVTYHPAYLLRNLADKAKAWEDLCFVRRLSRDLESPAGAPS
jgi:DNA polymerase